jgi:hypothetical protein
MSVQTLEWFELGDSAVHAERYEEAVTDYKASIRR